MRARRVLAGVAAAAMIPLVAPGAASAAGGGDELSVESAVLPVGASVPSLSEQQQNAGREGRDTSGQDDDRAQAALETVGPAASYAPRTSEPSNPVSPIQQAVQRAAAAGGTYPDPPRTMSAKECEAGLGEDKKFFIKSRFAVCSGALYTQTWLQNKKPVGESRFALLAVGTVAKGSREMKVQYHFIHLDQTGKTGTSGLMISPEVTVPQKWPAGAGLRQGGSIPSAQSWAKLKAETSPGFEHRLSADAGQGSKPDDAVFAVYQPEVHIKFPAGWKVSGSQGGKLFLLAPRWDTASYLTKKGGAAFRYVVDLPYSTKTGAPEKAAAEHVKAAYTKPDTTKPPNTKKDIPGRDADRPLHRLFHDEKRRDANRSQAIKMCKKYWGDDYAQGKKYQCDEFPFSTTYEGAAQASKVYDPNGKAPKNNYSAKPIASADNGAGGNILGAFYKKNRILDGKDDGFTVKID